MILKNCSWISKILHYHHFFNSIPINFSVKVYTFILILFTVQDISKSTLFYDPPSEDQKSQGYMHKTSHKRLV